jgi:hypothetical protein
MEGIAFCCFLFLAKKPVNLIERDLYIFSSSKKWKKQLPGPNFFGFLI